MPKAKTQKQQAYESGIELGRLSMIKRIEEANRQLLKEWKKTGQLTPDQVKMVRSAMRASMRRAQVTQEQAA